MFSRKKKFFVLSIALLCVSCLIFTGCSNNRNDTPPSSSQTDRQNETDRTDGTDGISGNNMNATDRTNSTGQQSAADKTTRTDNGDLHQRAEKIASAVTKEIAQVKDSRVVISEHMAYVSVEIDKTADTAESSNLKEEISRITKKTDPNIETVYVMEDADTFTRMKEIGRDIADGKPVSGFVNELENMFVRVTPTKQ